MRDVLPKIRALGAELVVVGSGQPNFARAFREDLNLDCPILLDPELRAYAAAGLRRDMRSTFNLKALGHGFRALRGGFRQEGIQGDPWQQGGVLVINPAGTVLFQHVSEAAGDHPDPARVVAALG